MKYQKCGSWVNTKDMEEPHTQFQKKKIFESVTKVQEKDSDLAPPPTFPTKNTTFPGTT